MKIGSFDTAQRVLVIAEIGNNHEGDFTLAEELIGKAAESGADAVKFQTIQPDQLIHPDNEARLAQLQRYAFSFDQFQKLKETADRQGVMFLSTPFDLEAARFLDQIMPAFKIASGDNTFYPLLETTARCNKPIILSSGLMDLTQISYSASLIRKVWSDMDVTQDLAVLHCISSYPAPLDQVNLSAMALLKGCVSETVGYSDHTLGIDAAVTAVAMGAEIIEKHFTIDKNHSDFRDHQLSADPDDLRNMVERITETRRIMGSTTKQIQECEAAAEREMRRSIAVRRTKRAGESLFWDDLVWLRPQGGLPPGQEWQVLGRPLREDLKAGTVLMDNHFQTGEELNA
ncbi:MAG: N-acetylneuraminate synthase family protein [Magnetococcales bacterium]|nr:N-acetylneuraminate synthase family protein [Magnetococcales bacterium]